jgi:hypothetical protein
MASDYFRQLREELNGGSLSQRRYAAQRDQRVRNGDIAPGQRSLNEPYNGN